MSGRRPIERLTAKNKKTGEITELLAVWPPREAGYPKGITVNKDLTVAQIAIFLFKMVIFIWLQMQIRWTLPRFRYDQLMKLGWLYLLPLSLLNLVVTAIIMYAVR